MLAASGTLAAAIDALDRMLAHRLRVNWVGDPTRWDDPINDLSGFVQQVSISRSVTTDLPDAARLVSGTSAATMTVDLAAPPTSTATPGSTTTTGQSYRGSRTYRNAEPYRGAGATLSGGYDVTETVPASAYFSRWNRESPLAGLEKLTRPLILEVGAVGDAGPELLTAFTGQTRALTVSAGGRTAQLECVDNSELIRTRVDLPMILADDGGVTAPAVKPNLSASWIVEWVLRQNAFYALPPPRPLSRLSATLRGSAWPEIGAIFDARGPGFQPCNFRAPNGIEVFTTSGQDIERLNYTPDSGLGTNDGNGILVEFAYLGLDDLAVDQGVIQMIAPTGAHVSVYRTPARQLRVRYYRTPTISGELTGPTMDAGGAATAGGFVGLHLAFAASAVTATWRYKGTTTTATLASTSVGGQASMSEVRVARAEGSAGPNGAPAIGAVNARGLLVSADTAPPGSWGDAHVPNAFIGPSLNSLVATPPISDRVSWSVIQDIAKAENAVCLLDAAGNVHYRTRRYWTLPPATVSQAEITADTSLIDLSSVEQVDHVRNRVVISAKAPIVSAVTDVWRASYPTALAPSSSRTFLLGFAGPAANVGTSVTPVDGDYTHSSYEASTSRDGSGARVSNLAFALSPTAESALLTITNPNPFVVYLVYSGAVPGTVRGYPSLRIAGQKVDFSGADTGMQVDVRDAASIDIYGEQVYEAPASEWLQQLDSIDSLAADLLATLKTPQPVLSGVKVVGDPRIELCDRVTLIDPVLGLLGDYWVVGDTRTLSPDGGFTAELTLRQAT